MKILKTILSEIKAYKIPTLLIPILLFIGVIFEMLIPLLLASIIDNGINAGNMTHIIKIGIYMTIAAVTALICSVSAGSLSATASCGLAKNLRERMFENIQTFSFSDIDYFSQASLITRVTKDVSDIQSAFHMIICVGVQAPLNLIIAFYLSYRVSHSFAFIYFVAIIFLIIVFIFISISISKIFLEIFNKYDYLNESIRENIRGIRVVKSFVREVFEKEKFYKANQNICNMFIKVNSAREGLSPIIVGVVYACIIAVCWIGSHKIIYGDLSTGTLMSLISYCMNILLSLMMLSMGFWAMLMASASFIRVEEVINYKTSLKTSENPVFTVADGSIVFKNVNLSYHENAEDFVLKDINLEIKSGETIGIIGGTGSAKSSLISLIPRLYDASSGNVYIGGIDVTDYDIDTLRNNVSVVLQSNVLFSGTILENLRWGDPNASLEDCKKACVLACADEFIENFTDGYNTYIEQDGTNLSGGQKQRLCIARALLKHPKILLLDDSTSAVDTETDTRIRKAFNEELSGITKIIIAQRISSVMNADRIIVMDDGTISGFGTHDYLLETNDIYKDVYKSQTSGESADFDVQE